MANTKQAQKAVRKIERRTIQNRHVKSRLKTLAKKARAAAQADGEPTPEAVQTLRQYMAALDKAAKRGIIHANKADRHKAAIGKKAMAPLSA